MTMSITQAHKLMSIGCIPELLKTVGSEKKSTEEFVVQVLEIRPVLNSSDHFTLILSDGMYYSDCYLNVHLTPLILNNTIKPQGLVKVTDFFVHKVKSKPTIVICDVDVLSLVDDIVGQPSNSECLGMDLSSTFKPPVKDVGSTTTTTSSGSGSGSSSSSVEWIDIAAISPWKKKWKLKARVTMKGELKSYNSARAQGEMFKGILTDKHGAQIEFVCFQNSRKWHEKLDKGHVYEFSDMQVTVAKKEFAVVPHAYQLGFKPETTIKECEETDEIGKIAFHFKTLQQVSQMDRNAKADVCVVVKSFSDLQNIKAKKDGQDLFKRDLLVVDASEVQMCLTIWGNMAKTHDGLDLDGQPVIAVTNCSLGEYNNQKTLSTSRDVSELIISPDCDEARELKEWWDSQGKTKENFAVVSEMSTMGGPVPRLELATLRDDKLLGTKAKPDMFEVKATVGNILATVDKPPWYLACPDVKCKKQKATRNDDGKVCCDKCYKAYDDGKLVYCLKFYIQDGPIGEQVTAWDLTAQKILGGKHEAKHLHNMISSGKEEDFGNIMVDAQGKEWLFRIKAQTKLVKGTTNLEFTVVDVKAIDAETEKKYQEERKQTKGETKEEKDHSDDMDTSRDQDDIRKKRKRSEDDETATSGQKNKDDDVDVDALIRAKRSRTA